jgi:hypothetical protein
VRAELRWAPDGVAPGKQVWVGQIAHQPEWHTY